MQLNKPVNAKELNSVIQSLLPYPIWRVDHPGSYSNRRAGELAPIIFVVDDDGNVRDAIRNVLEDDGWAVEDFASCEAFLEAYRPGREACLLVDAYLPGMSGLELLGGSIRRATTPAIMMTGDSDVQIAVQAMKAGASDFVEKPIGRGELLESIERALEQSRGFKQTGRLAEVRRKPHRGPDAAAAPDYGSRARRPPQQEYRSGSWHQPAHCRKPPGGDHDENGAKSLPALARLALAAAKTGSIEPSAQVENGQSATIAK